MISTDIKSLAQNLSVLFQTQLPYNFTDISKYALFERSIAQTFIHNFLPIHKQLIYNPDRRQAYMKERCPNIILFPSYESKGMNMWIFYSKPTIYNAELN